MPVISFGGSVFRHYKRAQPKGVGTWERLCVDFEWAFIPVQGFDKGNRNGIELAVFVAQEGVLDFYMDRLSIPFDENISHLEFSFVARNQFCKNRRWL